MKKKFVPTTIPTRPELENSKKIQKIKTHHSGIISIQTDMRMADKERKKF